MLVDGPPSDMALHRAALQIAHAARRAGWSYAEFHQAMTDSGHGLAEALGRQQGVQRRLRTWWRMAHANVAHDRKEVARVLAEFRAEADAMPWTGRGGSRERLVYEGILIMCGDRGVFSSAISVRDLEIVTTVKDVTCSKALSRLEGKRLIRRVFRGSGGYAARMEPMSPARALGARSEGNHLRSQYLVSSDDSAIRWVGKRAYLQNGTDGFCPTLSLREIMASDAMAVLDPHQVRVMHLLSAGPQPSARAIAARLGTGPATCISALEGLVVLGLAEHVFGQWRLCAAPRDRLRAVAGEHRGFRASLRQRVEDERAAFSLVRLRGEPRPGLTGLGSQVEVVDALTGEVLPGRSVGR